MINVSSGACSTHGKYICTTHCNMLSKQITERQRFKLMSLHGRQNYLRTTSPCHHLRRKDDRFNFLLGQNICMQVYQHPFRLCFGIIVKRTCNSRLFLETSAQKKSVRANIYPKRCLQGGTKTRANLRVHVSGK